MNKQPFCRYENLLYKQNQRWLAARAIVASVAVVFLAIAVSACGSESMPPPSTEYEAGQVVSEDDIYGAFYVYVPINLPGNPEILVLVHGTPPEEDQAVYYAEYYIRSWVAFAEENGFILIAPAFSQQDFSSYLGDHAMGGYRGLFGREIGADEWALRLVDAYQGVFGLAGERFYLYGHSAGGQFTGRFLVTHPERVKRAVISSAATYPQPDPQVAWPFGMGALHAEIEWDAETVRRVDITPDKQKWLAATQAPLTVIVGMNDSTELAPEYIPGQRGTNRIAIGGNWVEDMAAFAEANGLESRFTFELIPGKGHSMGGLIAYSQAALLPPAE